MGKTKVKPQLTKWIALESRCDSGDDDETKKENADPVGSAGEKTCSAARFAAEATHDHKKQLRVFGFHTKKW